MTSVNPADRMTEDDRAQAAAQQWHERAILAHRRAAAAAPAPAWTPGTCRNCGEVVEGVWCDDDCRADHERRQARGAR